jgi:hypothetical protein
MQLKSGVYHQGPTTFGITKNGTYEPKSDFSIRLKAFVNAGGKNTGFVAEVTRDFDGLQRYILTGGHGLTIIWVNLTFDLSDLYLPHDLIRN